MAVFSATCQELCKNTVIAEENSFTGETRKILQGIIRDLPSNNGRNQLVPWWLVAQTVKNPPAIWETQVWSLGQEDPLEKGMATHFSILAWRILWTEEPVRL